MHTCRRGGGACAGFQRYLLPFYRRLPSPLPSYPPPPPPTQPYYVTGTLQLREEDDTSLCHPLTVPHPVSSSRRALIHLPKNKQCPSMVSCSSDCEDQYLFCFFVLFFSFLRGMPKALLRLPASTLTASRFILIFTGDSPGGRNVIQHVFFLS